MGLLKSRFFMVLNIIQAYFKIVGLILLITSSKLIFCHSLFIGNFFCNSSCLCYINLLLAFDLLENRRTRKNQLTEGLEQAGVKPPGTTQKSDLY